MFLNDHLFFNYLLIVVSVLSVRKIDYMLFSFTLVHIGSNIIRNIFLKNWTA